MKHSSLEALMTGLIDYAGLFPPARLGMPDAIGRYLADGAGPDAWMLGRFVCPATRLGELVTALPARAPELEVRVSAVLRGGPRGAEFASTLAEDVAAAIAAERESGERVLVGCLEARLPGEVIAARDPVRVADFLGEALDTVRSATYGMPAMFLEAPATGAWEGTLEPVIDGLLEAQMRELEAHSDDPASLGFKLRCGGPTPADVPGEAAVAHVIECCVRGDVPLKCTAGLHHPVRREVQPGGPWMHGFLNVFVATLLASAHGLGAGDLLPVLRETDAGEFRFHGDVLQFGGYRMTSREITDHRELAGSFGSCSFDEPREDLRALHLLEPVAEGA